MDKNERLYEQNTFYDSASAPHACLVLPWWVREPKQVYFPKHNCIVEPLICGEDVFRSAYLVKCVQRLREKNFLKPIYVFILTSTPEDKGMDIPTYETISMLGKSDSMVVEHKEAIEKANKGKGKLPVSLETMKAYGINVIVASLWTCKRVGKNDRLQPDEYEQIYIHAKVAIVDDAAFTIGSANLNLRSMAIDSELNILSTASDVAYRLRCDLFEQAARHTGSDCFGNMKITFDDWNDLMRKNKSNKDSGEMLESMLLPFFVDRKPGEPIV